MTGRPSDGEFAPFYAGYVSLVPEDDVMGVLERQVSDIRIQLQACPPEREIFRYAPGKWSVREVVGHMSDAEKIFGYRALCISRGEQAALPGFDENHYVALSTFAQCRLAELVDELVLIREANLVTLRRLDAAAWQRWGNASGKPVSLRALAFVMAGHVRHHLSVLGARYSIRGH
jgi:hypothetical protein